MIPVCKHTDHAPTPYDQWRAIATQEYTALVHMLHHTARPPGLSDQQLGRMMERYNTLVSCLFGPTQGF